jgi:TRAP transporter TAXI family solute receptor
MGLRLRTINWAVLVVGCSMMSLPAAGETQFTIGTGGVSGVYHQIGASVCRFLEKSDKGQDLDCLAISKGGSVHNLQALREGALDLAVVQSDLQHHAYHGTSIFESVGPNKELRVLFSVVPESFTVIAGAHSDISTMEDLKGQRVNIGNPGSGQRVAMEALMQHLGWTIDDFESATEIKSALQAEQICLHKIDAAIYVVAHPNLSVREATASCDSILVPVAGPEIEEFIAANPHFVKTFIPADLYAANLSPVPSFGVTATVVATSATSPEVVYQVVKAVFENLEKMRTLLPVFANLNKEFMLSPHHAAPWHPGALKYFQEAGMM